MLLVLYTGSTNVSGTLHRAAQMFVVLYTGWHKCLWYSTQGGTNVSGTLHWKHKWLWYSTQGGTNVCGTGHWVAKLVLVKYSVDWMALTLAGTNHWVSTHGVEQLFLNYYRI